MTNETSGCITRIRNIITKMINNFDEHYESKDNNYCGMTKYYSIKNDSPIYNDRCLNYYCKKLQDNYNKLEELYDDNDKDIDKLANYCDIIKINCDNINIYYKTLESINRETLEEYNKTRKIMEEKEDIYVNSLVMCGNYYKKRKKYEKSKKYYLMGVDMNSTYSMYKLGYYYQYINASYKNMKKYYLMAINGGNNSAMNNLACYYYNKKKYNKMKKYYRMAIDRGDRIAMYNIGCYYRKIENYGKSRKYLTMAASGIDNTFSDKLVNLKRKINEIL